MQRTKKKKKTGHGAPTHAHTHNQSQQQSKSQSHPIRTQSIIIIMKICDIQTQQKKNTASKEQKREKAKKNIHKTMKIT